MKDGYPFRALSKLCPDCDAPLYTLYIRAKATGNIAGNSRASSWTLCKECDRTYKRLLVRTEVYEKIRDLLPWPVPSVQPARSNG